MASLLGLHSLPVIMPVEPLTLSLVTAAHEEDHRRSPKDILARARRQAWIPGGISVAKKVVRSCMWCRRRRKVMNKQLMAELPAEKLTASAPFVFTAVDLFGPFTVKDTAKGRRSFKCWGSLYSCLATKVVAIFCCPGYDAECFLTTHLKFTSIYGVPSKIVADHGPNIVAAASALDWDRVVDEAGKSGTVWTFTPKGCSWWNEQAERTIRMARDSLQHVIQKGALLDFHQLEAAFLRVQCSNQLETNRGEAVSGRRILINLSF